MNLKVIYWNVQGCCHPKFISSAKQYLWDSRPDVVVFVDPRISDCKADSVITALVFSYSHRVEAHGFSGGIWLAWYDSVNIEILYNHFQYIHCRITTLRDNQSTIATMMYASPNAMKRKALCSSLHNLTYVIRFPWIIFGDFNATFTDSDRHECASSAKPSKAF
ncbi:hypothetical protein HRI_001392300 [Hibiscus trionum]|uniref:Endonuclease/exonuclease/phosphatase domain-containing protein n=1 Tax=Hibiscus trionum TaxID=183268 RepID=A0A9W7HJX6_HIBTR|nr:hypothetical protein HRI_001392300 [Hibiscus trionum]